MRAAKKSVLVPIILLVAVLAAACTVNVGATSLTVVQAQEDGFFENGDEPYVAVIKWRVIPGTAGSALRRLWMVLASSRASSDAGWKMM